MIRCPKMNIEPYVFNGKEYKDAQVLISVKSCRLCECHRGLIGRSKKRALRVKCGHNQKNGRFTLLCNVSI